MNGGSFPYTQFIQSSWAGTTAQAIVGGFRKSVEEMKECGLEAQDSIHMMLVTQYLDTLKEFSKTSSAIMVPHGPGALKDIEAQVRDGFTGAMHLSRK